jgi:hypothetical protein
MPESVTDRPTKAHEQIFLLTKSERYHYDREAILEPLTTDESENYPARASVTGRGTQGFAAARGNDQDKSGGFPCSGSNGIQGRNTVGTHKPFPEAHFATFPEELITPCVLAGCPPQGKRCDCQEVICTPTGSGGISDPSVRTGRAGMNRPRRPNEGRRPITRFQQRCYAEQIDTSPFKSEMEMEAGGAIAHYVRTDRSGARPVPPNLLERWLDRKWLHAAPEECDCPVEPAGTVLDPFTGSGTTGVVALRNGCNFIGIDLNPDYIEMARRRIDNVPLLLFEEDGAPNHVSTESLAVNLFTAES